MKPMIFLSTFSCSITELMKIIPQDSWNLKEPKKEGFYFQFDDNNPQYFNIIKHVEGNVYYDSPSIKYAGSISGDQFLNICMNNKFIGACSDKPIFMNITHNVEDNHLSLNQGAVSQSIH